GLLMAYGAYVAWVAPADFDQTVAVALFLQMFAASTGYADRATRGHFDSILAGRSSRWPIAGAHWLLSIAPGLTLWVLLAAMARVGRPEVWPTPLMLPG